MANKEGTWLSINDYSRFKNISISTIRRRLRAGHLKSRMIDAKYEIFTPVNIQEINSSNEDKLFLLIEENQRIKKENLEMKEKISELEMLVNLYEHKLTIPPIPNQELFS